MPRTRFTFYARTLVVTAPVTMPDAEGEALAGRVDEVVGQVADALRTLLAEVDPRLDVVVRS